MAQEKFIVIGCDDMASLPIVLNNIKGAIHFSNNIISATRVSDMIGIVNSLDPELVILYFHNNHSALNDISCYVKKTQIPLLCLTKKYENESLYYTKNNIIFTYPLEHIGNLEYLGSRINSIFLLQTQVTQAAMIKPNTSFADAAIQAHQVNDNKDLSRYVMELDQKVEVLSKIKSRIAELYARVDDPIRAELISIVNAIKMSANDNKLWEDFKLYFEQTNPRFLVQLAQRYPVLTPIDLKYCCYLKLNMTNDDIRNLLGINQESVRTHKYRLKKKMALPKGQDLRNYLRSVG